MLVSAVDTVALTTCGKHMTAMTRILPSIPDLHLRPSPILPAHLISFALRIQTWFAGVMLIPAFQSQSGHVCLEEDAILGSAGTMQTANSLKGGSLFDSCIQPDRKQN